MKMIKKIISIFILLLPFALLTVFAKVQGYVVIKFILSILILLLELWMLILEKRNKSENKKKF